jgi:hypothetical protein
MGGGGVCVRAGPALGWVHVGALGFVRAGQAQEGRLQALWPLTRPLARPGPGPFPAQPGPSTCRWAG